MHPWIVDGGPYVDRPDRWHAAVLLRRRPIQLPPCRLGVLRADGFLVADDTHRKTRPDGGRSTCEHARRVDHAQLDAGPALLGVSRIDLVDVSRGAVRPAAESFRVRRIMA